MAARCYSLGLVVLVLVPLAGCGAKADADFGFQAFQRSRTFAAGEGKVSDLRTLWRLRSQGRLRPRDERNLEYLAATLPIRDLIADRTLRDQLLPTTPPSGYVIYGRVLYESDFGQLRPLPNTPVLRAGLGKWGAERLPEQVIVTNEFGFYVISLDRDPAGYRVDAVSATTTQGRPSGRDGAPGEGRRSAAASAEVPGRPPFDPSAIGREDFSYGFYSDDWEIRSAASFNPLQRSQPELFYLNDIVFYQQEALLSQPGADAARQ